MYSSRGRGYSRSERGNKWVRGASSSQGRGPNVSKTWKRTAISAEEKPEQVDTPPATDEQVDQPTADVSENNDARSEDPGSNQWKELPQLLRKGVNKLVRRSDRAVLDSRKVVKPTAKVEQDAQQPTADAPENKEARSEDPESNQGNGLPQLSRKGVNKLVRRSDRAVLDARKVSDSSESSRSTNQPKKEMSENISMTKFGANKLVLKKLPPEHAVSTVTSTPAVVSSDALTGMKAKGRNKLVSSSRLVEEKQLKETLKRKRLDLKETLKRKRLESEASVNAAGLKSKGRNKLVSETRALEDEERLKENLKQRRIESKRDRAKGPAKRVKLQDDEEEKKLTDFAYQQTSKSMHSGWRNMGLVRVAPEDTAPICPTFSRGLPCTKINCTKRHDVPLESATPICSFFQRNGLCLKRDTCPFRHIKVNPHATICAQFNLLGYCEEQDCLYKHVRERKTVVKLSE